MRLRRSSFGDHERGLVLLCRKPERPGSWSAIAVLAAFNFGEFSDQLPTATVQVVHDGRALRSPAQARFGPADRSRLGNRATKFPFICPSHQSDVCGSHTQSFGSLHHNPSATYFASFSPASRNRHSARACSYGVHAPGSDRSAQRRIRLTFVWIPTRSAVDVCAGRPSSSSWLVVNPAACRTMSARRHLPAAVRGLHSAHEDVSLSYGNDPDFMAGLGLTICWSSPPRVTIVPGACEGGVSLIKRDVASVSHA